MSTTDDSASRIQHARVDTPCGAYLLLAQGSDLVGIYRQGQRHCPRPEVLGSPVAPRDHEVLGRCLSQLREYFHGTRRSFDLPVRPSGSAFQREVLAAISAIPYGSTRSYGQLAAELGRPRAAQAVGSAVGRNPISIVIPCHRVLGASGALTGYAGGLDVKRKLLRLEGVLPATDQVPLSQ
ncbi:methylated-DNA--[protein]-cysteine S-methyltransferase [Gephyromycinifex aptenodytis]|uniref:methylated-DNA--[protein]-cysteine S-methyltransferase n=1 Tax=Gephyromycinifex aptenodytis TaxID=2716227 RepID=UPI0014459C46|nr:methylated-DNA--[protein]-cysteine S-methyltransferase [Gephyromycinifex aptenodytis]